MGGWLAVALWTGGSIAAPLPASEVAVFVDEMAGRHGFARETLERVFDAAQFQPDIIEAMSRPATARPWHQFHPAFLNPRRIAGGVEFWSRHAATLARAHREFGVPEEIVVAIIGVETDYGARAGRHRVLDALATLAFGYPRRAAFFREELEQYLLLDREQGGILLDARGSYAGAMGIPQFMPGSYRRHAVDFDGDGRVDLIGNVADAIGSVAHYLFQHGWEAGEAVAVPALVNGERYRDVLYAGRKPSHTLDEMRRYGVVARAALPRDRAATVVELDTGAGFEYWLGLNNFYVITRYNRSVHYAMAVWRLAEAIRAARAAGASPP